MESLLSQSVPGASPTSDAFNMQDAPLAPQTALLNFFFPGFSVFSGIVQKYLHIDLNIYIPLVLLCGGLTWAWQYFSEYVWGVVETYLMSVVDIRTDDEVYNYLMTWVAAQSFAQGARRFVVNTNLNSRSWFLRWWDDDEDDEDYEEGSSEPKTKKKALAYTPTFGTHWFWYKGRLLMFKRSQNREQASFLVASEREEISVSCFGRNPWVLKQLLHEARQAYMKRDEAKTCIYRGTTKGGTTEPSWQRCMARTSRPFSTVILNEKVKKDLIDDVTDYLNPSTRRWYSNRGIPYRRGYLLYGPPGTGKSSLSLALAGFFKMRIYIVSLSSVTANEETLASLFAELPRRCVVLLEDIDTAGLTHTREEGKREADNSAPAEPMVPGQVTPGVANGANNAGGRLSLSGLLNILDGVASQEGRVLIMTTNHLEKLDKALIRPGRVDMIVKFDKADSEMTSAIFRAIFAPLEGDNVPQNAKDEKLTLRNDEAEKLKAAEQEQEKEKIIARVSKLADDFAEKIPAHEFSPAELQGFLLKNKRDPDAAVAGAEQWVIDTRKEKKEKELKEAEEKRKAEDQKKKEEETKKEEEEKKKKEDEEQKKKEEAEKEKKEARRKAKEASKKSRRKSKKNKDGSSSSSSEDSSSESEAENDGAKNTKPAGDMANAEESKVVVAVSEADTATSAHLEVRPLTEDSKHGKHGSDSGYSTPGSP